MKRKADEFEHALQSSARGEPVQGPLAPLVETALRVESLSETPPPPLHGLMQGRQRFLTEAARLREKDLRRQPRPALALRLATAMAALLLLFGAVLGVGGAAADSLPGQPLYGAKLASERLRLALTFQPESRSALVQGLAEERMDEILALLEAKREVDASVSNRASRQLQQALATAARLEDTAAPLALQKLAEAIRRREQAVRSAAGESPQSPVQEFIREMERVREEARSGQGDPDGLRQRLRQGTPPEPTTLPGASGTPQPSRTPNPQPSRTPEPSHTPQRTGMPSASPGASGTPGHTPGSSATPQPTGGPPASHTPGATATSQSTGQPHASRTPDPTGTPAPTGGPSHTPAPGQTPGNGGGGGNRP